jgi:hypothetical protein
MSKFSLVIATAFAAILLGLSPAAAGCRPNSPSYRNPCLPQIDNHVGVRHKHVRHATRSRAAPRSRVATRASGEGNRYVCHPTGLNGPWTVQIAFGNPANTASYRVVGQRTIGGRCGTVHGPRGAFACATVLQFGRVRHHWWWIG